MTRAWHVAVLPGDGIGAEVTEAATAVLQAAAARHGLDLRLQPALAGAAALRIGGNPLPPATVAVCDAADAILFGAVGAPEYQDLPPDRRPEMALSLLRRRYGLYLNLRPARLYPGVEVASPLRPDLLRKGIDLVVVRELSSGLYNGEPRGAEPLSGGGTWAYNTCAYTSAEVQRVARGALALARSRRRRLVSVDKANALETSRLWRQEVTAVAAAEFPDVAVEHVFVDAAAMALVLRPADFDVVLCDNMGGDILSDLAGALVGSIGLLPSASLGDGRVALYEPVHGSAPDIAGRGIANPVGAILSAALLLRHTCHAEAAAAAVEQAVTSVLAAGFRTADLCGPGDGALGTMDMTRQIIAAMEKEEPNAAGAGVGYDAAGR